MGGRTFQAMVLPILDQNKRLLEREVVNQIIVTSNGPKDQVRFYLS